MRPSNCFPVAPNPYLAGIGFLEKFISWILGFPEWGVGGG